VIEGHAARIVLPPHIGNQIEGMIGVEIPWDELDLAFLIWQRVLFRDPG